MRTAKLHYHFVELKRDGWFVDYAVEARQGQRRWTVGRICGRTGSSAAWNALPIGASAWSRYHRTRRVAFEALLAREDFRDVETWL